MQAATYAHILAMLSSTQYNPKTIIEVRIFLDHKFCYISILNEVEVVNSVTHALDEDRVLNFCQQMASVIQFKMAHHQAAYLALFICCLKV